jgi:beta-lactamase regulating signal transducer with metallopeptidase domain
MAQVRVGRGGPAVVGLIWPRIVLPADEDGYSAEERELIRAHERAHVARRDPRAAALASLTQCVCWFNPVMHVAAYLLRLDQELACDAAVTLRRPWARALYARTLLKTQLGGSPLPFACAWRAWGQHPLELRIAQLKRRGGGAPAAPRPSGASIVAAGVDVIRP